MTGNTSSPIPNYVNPETRAPIVLAVNTCMAVLAVTFVSCRILVKTKLHKIGPEDILIVIAMVLVLTVSFVICISTKYGHGRHAWDRRPEWRAPSRKFGFVSIVLYNPCLIFIKTSILAFYLRLAPAHQEFRRICYLLMVYIVCMSTAMFLVNIFGCDPIYAGWTNDPTLKAKCVNKPALYMTSGVNNLVTDVILLILPIPILMRLNLSWRRLLGLVFVFSMGFLVTAVSTVRLRMYWASLQSVDPTWEGALTGMWSVAELNTGIMTACMPTTQLFISWLLPGLMKAKEDQGNSSQHTPTIGSGGGGFGMVRINPLDAAVVSHANTSEEYIMDGMSMGGEGAKSIGSEAGANRVGSGYATGMA